MKFVFIFVFVVLLFVCLNEGKDFTIGTRANNLLISTQKVKYRSLPLIRRDKDYTYIDPKERIIKVINFIVLNESEHACFYLYEQKLLR